MERTKKRLWHRFLIGLNKNIRKASLENNNTFSLFFLHILLFISLVNSDSVDLYTVLCGKKMVKNLAKSLATKSNWEIWRSCTPPFDLQASGDRRGGLHDLQIFLSDFLYTLLDE